MTAYTLEGPDDAPVLMFSNSLGTTRTLWQAQAAILRQHYRILRYDTRGHGDSASLGRDQSGFTLEQLGQDVLQLLDTLKLQQVTFCGISMGGLTGLWLGVHAADRLQGLIVANSAARIGSAESWRSRAAQVRQDGMEAIADGAAARWFTPAYIATGGNVVQQQVEALRHCSPQGYAACCLALADADLRDQVATIKTNTLIIGGRHDPVTTIDDARFLQSRISGARLQELDASHLSNLEAGAAFTTCIVDFMR